MQRDERPQNRERRRKQDDERFGDAFVLRRQNEEHEQQTERED